VRTRLSLLLVTGLALTACGRLLAGSGGSPVPGPTPSPSTSPTGGGIEFVLADSYRQGQRIAVRITNTGDRPYPYNASGYEACNLTYRFEGGREFIIPPGTHCDIVLEKQIRPGETVTLFTWHLDQCLVDDWGCVESEALPPGRYTIEGSFEPVGGGGPSRPRATFEIVPAHNIPDVAPDDTDGGPEPTD
jgi:hypothetical protein